MLTVRARRDRPRVGRTGAGTGCRHQPRRCDGRRRLVAEVAEQPAEYTVLDVIATAADALEMDPVFGAGCVESMIEENVHPGQHQVPRHEDRGEEESLKGPWCATHEIRKMLSKSAKPP